MMYLDSDLRASSSFCSDKMNRANNRNRWQSNSNAPKIPSNLVKSTILPSFSSQSSRPIASEMIVYDRQKLLEFLTERETNLFKTRDEYEEQFENFFALAKKFHIEKLNNLKLTFKNQILKQQIYFETELLELSKECIRDYECSTETKGGRRTFSSKKQSTKSDKFEREKQIVKLFKSDMKKLLDYMRDALISSSDTLIEAYETCHILKTLETIENNFQKQNSQMKLTTSSLIKNQDRMEKAQEIEDDSEYDSELNELNKQLSEEQELFNSYRNEMDELMHILDEIELQHLQRKDQLTTKTKLLNKLKMKLKFIEVKYDKLNKKTSDLKYESYIFKKLWIEKQHCSTKNNDVNFECNLYTKSSTLSSMSSTPSTSSSSRSSSTSSLSDCVCDIISSTNDNINASSESSSSSSISNQDMSELMTASDHNQINFEHLFVEHHTFENTEAKTEDEDQDDFPNLSITDYNRKLCLINELINLHKSKMSPKDLWSISSETEIIPSNNPSLNNFTQANIKYLDLKEQEDINHKVSSSICYKPQSDLFSESMDSNIVLYNVKQDTCLDLTDVSTDGDRVCIENCNLKLDHDVSDWYITRQIEDMSIRSYKFPQGSTINAGKCLKVEKPFENDQLEYLVAIKSQKSKFEDKKQSCVKIKTRLVSPDGTLKALHTQEIPQFYQEIFKYANLIKFL